MTLLYAIGGIAVLVILLVLLVLSRIKVAGPNQAFLVTGRQGRQVTSDAGVISRDSSGQKVVMGASVFVLPRRPEAAQDGPVQPPDPGGHPRCRLQAGREVRPRGRRDREGRWQRGLHPGRRAALPQPAGGHRHVHVGGARRCAALDRRRRTRTRRWWPSCRAPTRPRRPPPDETGPRSNGADPSAVGQGGGRQPVGLEQLGDLLQGRRVGACGRAADRQPLHHHPRHLLLDGVLGEGDPPR
jgi:hypothetical protein